MVERINEGSLVEQLAAEEAAEGGFKPDVGQYKGHRVQHESYAQSILEELAEGAEEMSFMFSEQVGSKLSRRKIGSLREQAGARSARQSKTMSGFNDSREGQALDNFIAQCRQMEKPSAQSLLEQVRRFSGDVSSQYSALGELRQQGGKNSAGLQVALEKALQILEQQSGPGIRAGLNIGPVAAGFAQSPAELQELRDFYRAAVLDYHGLHGMYRQILENMDYYRCAVCRARFRKKDHDCCPACGAARRHFQYNEDGFFIRTEFLMKSLGCELDSQGPSCEPAALQKIIDDLYFVESIGNLHRDAGSLLGKMHKEFRAGQQLDPPDLIEHIFTGMEQQWTGGAQARRLTEKLGFENIVGKIYFLRHFKELVRAMPLKIFTEPDTREELLNSIQDALDGEIAREEG